MFLVLKRSFGLLTWFKLNKIASNFDFSLTVNNIDTPKIIDIEQKYGN